MKERYYCLHQYSSYETKNNSRFHEKIRLNRLPDWIQSVSLEFVVLIVIQQVHPRISIKDFHFAWIKERISVYVVMNHTHTHTHELASSNRIDFNCRVIITLTSTSLSLFSWSSSSSCDLSSLIFNSESLPVASFYFHRNRIYQIRKEQGGLSKRIFSYLTSVFF